MGICWIHPKDENNGNVSVKTLRKQVCDIPTVSMNWNQNEIDLIQYKSEGIEEVIARWKEF